MNQFKKQREAEDFTSETKLKFLFLNEGGIKPYSIEQHRINELNGFYFAGMSGINPIFATTEELADAYKNRIRDK